MFTFQKKAGGFLSYLRPQILHMPFIEINEIKGKEVFPGFFGRGIHTGSQTFMYWTVDKDATVPQHSHLHEQFAHVIKGSFELTVGGETAVLEAGKVAFIPANIPHSGRAITNCELLDVFCPEREDYKF